MQFSQLLNMRDPHQRPRGPFPIADLWGAGVACVFLMRTLDVGKNAPTVQFDTARKVRSFFSNYARTTPGEIGPKFADGARISESSTNSVWFQRFMEGCHKRMGDVHKPDQALTIAEVMACLSILEEDWEKAMIWTEQEPVARFAAALVAGFCAALRGEEIGKLDLARTMQIFGEGMDSPVPHVALSLKGRVKGELSDKAHYLALAPVTRSGIRVSKWIRRLLTGYADQGVTGGALIRNTKGVGCRVKELDVEFHQLLRRVQRQSPGVVPESVDIESEYSFGRSLCRGSTSQARNKCVPKDVIEANN